MNITFLEVQKGNEIPVGKSYLLVVGATDDEALTRINHRAGELAGKCYKLLITPQKAKPLYRYYFLVKGEA